MGVGAVFNEQIPLAAAAKAAGSVRPLRLACYFCDLARGEGEGWSVDAEEGYTRPRSPLFVFWFWVFFCTPHYDAQWRDTWPVVNWHPLSFVYTRLSCTEPWDARLQLRRLVTFTTAQRNSQS